VGERKQIRTNVGHASVLGTRPGRAFRRFAAAAPLACLLALAPAPSPAAASPAAATSPAAESGSRRVVSQQNGSVTIRDGDRVRVNLEMGDVRVRTQASGSVQYRLRVEVSAGSSANAAAAPRFQVSARTTADGAVIVGRTINARSSDHFWVTLELDVPRSTPLEVSTQGGSVDVGDIDGRLVCDTAGGKIRVGRVGASARLQTAGGDVVVQDVNGDLSAITGGGGILAGAIRGNATLRSGGGHIRVARVDGEARMETGGGNIFLERAGARLITSTGGGRILVGEATGELQARTGGGGIRVWRVSGPAHIQTGAGSIFLAGVTSPVRATTAAGGITALFEVAGQAPPAPSTPVVQGSPRVPRAPRPPQGGTLGELECTGGDLVVFVPKDLGLNLDAAIGGGENFRIIVDSSFLMTLKTNEMVSGNMYRAEGAMGGGGPLLRLRATAGNILLRPTDGPEAMVIPAIPAMPAIMAIPPVPPRPPQESMEAVFADLDKSMLDMQRQLEVRQDALEAYASAQELQAMRMVRRSAQDQGRVADPWAAGSQNQGEVEYDGSSDQLAQIDGLREKVTALLTDRVIISATQLRVRLTKRVDPQYPEKARETGLEGPVRLRVAISRDGSIEDVETLSGDPLLADAAMTAVRQWRYRPTVLNGRQVPVLTVLTITFHHP